MIFRHLPPSWRHRTAIPVFLVSLALSSFSLSACNLAAQGPKNSSPSTASTATATHPLIAAATAANATAASKEAARRQIIAGTFIVGVRNYTEAKQALAQGVGGIFIPSWADPALLTTAGQDLVALRKETGRDFTVAIDFEGGRVQRHSEILGTLPPARIMADTLGPEEVYELGLNIGKRLAEHGFNVDFAPVVDVDYANLEVIGDRAFANRPDIVAKYSQAFGRGLRDAGITPVLKHFPGHGAATGDTHTGTVHSPPLEVLEATELQVYAQLLKELPEAAVMMSHLIVPGLSSPDLPASLDPAVYKLLRTGGYAGGTAPAFTGTIYTDDLSGMLAVTGTRSTATAALAALKAGADRVLWSSGDNIAETIDLISAAIDSGELSFEQISSAFLSTR
ncbi:glycoside hydrolase family 3 N-terminal domain-containing protein [Corynebacterium caspium]|uniref:glycoside hydrolase family 3 N-terminal domain-containing protein n=1 Tax=Corynebacterium caspium TaxID=234828 RepID=UPI00035EF624|nr:glycoside hydrolase family 3 N-terminal domain-containing protein [Corynebacterium caspium]WKD59952.1 Beta-hexosaminidase [Corynebacterium caspium DSM 44850]